ncbi:cytochrome b subunit of formate dehydrogenase [Bradyrhizobium sp. USDA 4353]
MKIRKTDYGTIILHWTLVGATVIAFLTGLRMATEAPNHAWIANNLDWLLPRHRTWTWHMPAGVVLASVAVAYMIYVSKAGLGRRVSIDKMRFKGLLGRRPARLGSISVMLHWVLFISMFTLIVTGGLLFFGVASGYVTMMIHWYATWVIPVFVVLHILVHFSIGGKMQLYRVFRPAPLPPPPPKLDPVELLTMLVEQSEKLEEAEAPPKKPAPAQRPPMREPMPAPRRMEEPMRGRPESRMPSGRMRPPPSKGNSRRRNPTFQSNPFVVATAAAIVIGSAMFAADYYAEDTVTVYRIASSDAPTLDGDSSDRVWRNIQPHMVTTNQGDNFDGTGESRVWIKAAHDGTWVYFLVIWEDPTRSLKQLPLIKKADGWHLLTNGFDKGDENDYNEDKFSMLFTTLPITLAADRTFHMSSQPMPDKPATLSGPRHSLHASAEPLRRRLVVEGHERRSDRLDGRRSFRPAGRADAGPGQGPDSLQGRVRARSGDGELHRQFHHRQGGRQTGQSGRQTEAPAEGRRCDDGGDGRDQSRSEHRRERGGALVHDGGGVGALLGGGRCADADRDGGAGGSHQRRIHRRPRRHSLRRTLGSRPLDARNCPQNGHEKQVRRSDQERCLHASRCVRPHPDPTYEADPADAT